MAIALVVVLTALPARESPKGADKPVSLAVIPPPVMAPDDPVTVEHTSPAPPPRLARATPVRTWQKFHIHRGDTLSAVFARAGLTPQDLHAVMHSGKPARSLRTIMPGKTINMAIDGEGNLTELRYRVGAVRDLVINRHSDGFASHWQSIKPTTIDHYATGSITASRPSLYLAARHAHLPDGVIMQLADIFQWDLSFALDLRQGDTFAVIFQQKYVDGKKVGDGDILAAEFTNMGKRYEAVLYQDAEGNISWYAPDGSSMRKAFLRDPVHFSYISSGFNPHRMHPILHRIMPHWGVDFVAPRGTPVRASGDGRVVIVRRNAASGRYIVIRHGSEFTTKYLHLSKFARGIHPGVAVKQGQVIGYVGQSGWATAPHLHYEFLINGVHRNPRTVPLPKASPVPVDEMDRFRQQTRPLLAKLDSIAGKTVYAMAKQPGPVSNSNGE